MPSVNYTVKLDEANKKQAESVLKELGLNLSVAINAYINAIARSGEIPFRLSLRDNTGVGEYLKEFLIYKSIMEKMLAAEAQAKDESAKRYSFGDILENFNSTMKAHS